MSKHFVIKFISLFLISTGVLACDEEGREPEAAAADFIVDGRVDVPPEQLSPILAVEIVDEVAAEREDEAATPQMSIDELTLDVRGTYTVCENIYAGCYASCGNDKACKHNCFIQCVLCYQVIQD
jgi:hypothetical protein